MKVTAQFFKLGSGVIKLEMDFNWSIKKERAQFASTQDQMLRQGFTVSIFPRRKSNRRK